MTCSDVIGFDTNDIGKHCLAIELGFSVDTGKSGKFGGKFYVFVQFCTVECQLQGEESRLRDRDMLGVRTDAKFVLKAMCKKLNQKTPFTYPVARALSCLDPRNMAGSPEQCKTMMRRLLSACVESGFVVEADCDEVMQQFDDFIHTCANGELGNVSVVDDCFDTFLCSRMAANYHKVWSICELALLLSHGEASVERGFSINKELVVENQSEQTGSKENNKGSHHPC